MQDGSGICPASKHRRRGKRRPTALVASSVQRPVLATYIFAGWAKIETPVHSGINQIGRSMLLLKQSEQQFAFHSDDRQQIDRARKEAEALFRPKPKLLATPTLADPSPVNVSVRKPRILRASVPPLDREMAKVRNSSEPQTAVSASQFAHTERERLNRTRAAIFKQQHELRAKLKAIDSELHAMDAYEAAKKGKALSGRRHRGRA